MKLISTAMAVQVLVLALLLLGSQAFKIQTYRNAVRRYMMQLDDDVEGDFPRSWFVKSKPASHKRTDRELETDAAKAFDYFKNTLKMSDETLEKILASYPSLMRYSVEDRLIPSVKVMQNYGFKIHEIGKMVSSVPSILTLGSEWSLPERFMSLKQMFSLSKTSLVDVVKTQPYLLTSSIDRNMEIASFFNDALGFSKNDLARLVTSWPNVAMTRKSLMEDIWKYLTQTCGLSDVEARRLILNNPDILVEATLQDVDQRLQLLEQVAGIVPPFKNFVKTIMRHPDLLMIDMDYFIRSNVAILQDLLELDDEQLKKLLGSIPQFLLYRPARLKAMIKATLHLLTCAEEYADYLRDDPTRDEQKTEGRGKGRPTSPLFPPQRAVWDAEPHLSEREMMEKLRMVEKYCLLYGQTAEEEEEESEGYDTSELQDWQVEEEVNFTPEGDVFDILQEDIATFDSLFPSTPIADLDAVRGFLLSQRLCLRIDKTNMHRITRAAPWMMVYRRERTEKLLGALAITLGLTSSELRRLLEYSPRIICLSPGGTLSNSLRAMAQLAIEQVGGQTAPPSDSSADMEGTTSRGKEEEREVTDSFLSDINNCPSALRGSLFQYRNHPVRRALRRILLLSPALLLVGKDRVMERLSILKEYGLPLEEFATLVHRSSLRLENWRLRMAVKLGRVVLSPAGEEMEKGAGLERKAKRSARKVAKSKKGKDAGEEQLVIIMDETGQRGGGERKQRDVEGRKNRIRKTKAVKVVEDLGDDSIPQ